MSVFKDKGTFLWHLSQTLNVENFDKACASCCQQNSSTVSLLTTPIRQSTSRGCLLQVGSANCNPLTALLRLVAALLYNLFLYSCAAVGKVSTDTARRAVRLSQSCLWDGLTHWFGWVVSTMAKVLKIIKDYVNAFKSRLDEIWLHPAGKFDITTEDLVLSDIMTPYLTRNYCKKT